jgi:hypothetical protein
MSKVEVYALARCKHEFSFFYRDPQQVSEAFGLSEQHTMVRILA